jgi:hypothetical protein
VQGREDASALVDPSGAHRADGAASCERAPAVLRACTSGAVQRTARRRGAGRTRLAAARAASQLAVDARLPGAAQQRFNGEARLAARADRPAHRRLCSPAPATFSLYRRACALEARRDYGQGSGQFASDHAACAEPSSHAVFAEASSNAGRLAHGRPFWAFGLQRPLRGNPGCRCSLAQLPRFDFPLARAVRLPRFGFPFLKELPTQRVARFIVHSVRKKILSECALSLSPYVCFRLATIPTSRIDQKAFTRRRRGDSVRWATTGLHEQ